MHLHLTLPESLAGHPSFVASPFAAGYRTAGADSETEEAASTSEAADDDDSSSTTATIFNVGILLLIPLGMYFLLIRPNKKRRQAAQELQSSITVGDEVLLTSGVYGFVTAMEDGSDVVWVEIDDDVQVRVTRAAISGKVNTNATAPADGADDDADDDDVDDDVDASETDPETETGTDEPAAPKRRAKTARSSKAARSRPTLKGTSTVGPATGADTAQPDTAQPDTAEPGDE